ncbi:MAG: 50S ribosomal protein L30 [Candidatus Marinimicrobia bacterium]|nr:50S ribosomal protein L30 [Candidatus Neomarinimicrobiota bacterium]|tara:strand:+ start:2033 stop:2233 length:201 start_codon:yes stop_codon:yes gene_type:complete
MMVKKINKSLHITQIKSGIGHNKKAKRTLIALGLRKLNQTVVHSDTPIIRGMVKKINFLLKVEESS